MKKIIHLLFLINLIIKADDQNIWKIRFEKVLEDIAQNSIKNQDWNDKDWQNFKIRQLANLPISNENDFYNFIKKALKDLSDNHSFLIPSTYQKTNNFKNNPKYFIKQSKGIGYIFLPTLMIDNPNTQDQILCEKWVLKFHKKLKKVINKVSKGWIIDLTQNEGGNIYPMIAALSHFIKDEKIGGWYIPKTKEKLFVKFDGNKFKIDNTELSFTHSFILGENNLPVIVIVGPKTGSSGEILALTLQKQKEITTVGKETFGVANGNGCIELPDKLGIIMLTSCYCLNTNDEPLYECKIKPNIILKKNRKKMIKWAMKFIKNKKKELIFR